MISPADGVVIYLGDAREEHLGADMHKISIFMSVFNVHINRMPVTGRVIDTFYKKGKFLDVRDARATFENEQSGLILEADGGARLVVVQVAGLIARQPGRARAGRAVPAARAGAPAGRCSSIRRGRRGALRPWSPDRSSARR